MLTACTNNNLKKEVATKDNHKEVNAKEIETGGIKPYEITKIIQCNGKVDSPPQFHYIVTAPINGMTTKVNYIPGNKVKKGAVLCVLQDRDFIDLQRRYLESKNNLEQLTIDFERKQALIKEHAVSEKDYNETKYSYFSAKTQYESLKAELALLNVSSEKVENKIMVQLPVYAPGSGIISSINLRTGQHVEASDILYEIIDPSHMHLELELFAKDLPLVAPNQKVVFTLPGREDEFNGFVHEINPRLDESSNSVKVHVHSDDLPQYVKPGTRIKAGIIVYADSIMGLPREAVVNKNNEYYIFLKKGNEFMPGKVEIGKFDDHYIEINNKEAFVKEAIVIKGTYYLTSILE